MSPELADAAVTFGTIIANLGRWREAAAMFEGALPKLEREQRATTSAFVEQCRGHLGPDSQPPRAQ
jgi:hypothetical protein